MWPLNPFCLVRCFFPPRENGEQLIPALPMERQAFSFANCWCRLSAGRVGCKLGQRSTSSSSSIHWMLEAGSAGSATACKPLVRDTVSLPFCPLPREQPTALFVSNLRVGTESYRSLPWRSFMRRWSGREVSKISSAIRAVWLASSLPSFFQLKVRAAVHGCQPDA